MTWAKWREIAPGVEEPDDGEPAPNMSAYLAEPEPHYPPPPHPGPHPTGLALAAVQVKAAALRPVAPPNIEIRGGIFGGMTTRPAPAQQATPFRSGWDRWMERALRDADTERERLFATWPHAQLLGADVAYLEAVWAVMPPVLQGWHREHNPELAARLDHGRMKA